MSECRRFVGKNVVVTGGAQGIGRAALERFAEEGARVVLVDRAAEQAALVAAELVARGIDCTCVSADLETFGGAQTAVATANGILGRIDVWVNNVGGTIWAKPFLHYEREEIIAEVNRSLWPTLWCCHAISPVLVRQRSGVIVNVSSLAPRVTHRIPYSACKGGVNAITTCLAWELGEYGIRVVGVAPGATDVGSRATPRRAGGLSEQESRWWREISEQYVQRTMLGRNARPEEQAAVIAFAASDDASYITGETIPVGGGYPA
jgi:dihydroxycyclohexadiene carboxylate dehydrogenase